MKNNRKILLFGAFVALFIFCFSCVAPEVDKDMPITTSSDEALKAFEEGRDYWEFYEAAKAREMFDKAIELDPEFAMAYLYRAYSGGGNKVFRANFDKAMSLSEKLSEGEKVFLEIFKTRNDGKGVEMESAVDQLVSLFPEDKRVHYLMGYFFYFNVGEQGIDFFKKTIELDENFAPAYNELGQKFTALREFDKAEKYLDKYAELAPGHPDPLLRLGTLYRQQGDLQKAVNTYKKMLEVDPESKPYLMIGNCYNFMEDYEQARKNYNMGYEMAENVGGKLSALVNKYISFVFEGDKEGALKGLDEYRAFAKENNRPVNIINSYRNQCWTAIIFEDMALAEESLEMAEELIISSELSEVSRSNYERGNHLWQTFFLTSKGDFEEAEKELAIYRQAVEERKMPGGMQTPDFLEGYMALRKGDYQEAIDLLSEAGDFPNGNYYIGEAYEVLGDTEMAKMYYEKVVAVNFLNLNLASVKSKAAEKLKDLQ